MHLLRHLRNVIGGNIHYHRRRKSMPLGILSKRSGVSRDRLEQYELGGNEISLEHLLRIACALDVEAGALFQPRR